MDVSMPSLGSAAAPRAVPDLRPTADAAATVRAARPPADALAVSAATAPVSVTQAALLSQSAIGAGPVDPAAGRAEEPERVLKPFGVGMLPHREGDDAASAKANEEPDRQPEGAAA